MLSAADLARRQVGDALYLLLLKQPGPMRASLLLRAIPPETGIRPAVARKVLAEDDRFVGEQGRWDLRVRAELGSMAFTAGVERVLEEFGGPLPLEVLSRFFAASAARDEAYYQGLLASLVEKGEHFVQVAGRVVPRAWMLYPEGQTEDDVLFYSGLDRCEELQALRPACTDVALRGAKAVETAANIVRAAGQPITNRVLGFLVYRQHPEAFDPGALLTAMSADDRVLALPGLRWTSGELRAEVAAELARLNAQAEETPQSGPDLETLLSEPLPPDQEGFFLEDAHIDAIYEILDHSAQPVAISELVSEVLELEPEDSRFVPAAHSVRGLLHDDPAIMDISVSRFLGRGGIPQWAKTIPDVLVPVPGRPGEDVILHEEGLRPGLAAKISDPYWDDVGDDQAEASDADLAEGETVYPITFRHLAAGTLKLRKMDFELFGAPETIRPTTLLTSDGFERMVWANPELGLVLGLADLYEHLAAAPGTLLMLSASNRPGLLVAEAVGQDEAAAVPPERLEALLAFAEAAGPEPPGVFAAMREVMSAYPEGVTFERLHAEVDVIRRTTRLQIASLLSYYQCFRPRDAEGNVWAFAPEAVAAGPIATKLKHVVT